MVVDRAVYLTRDLRPQDTLKNNQRKKSRPNERGEETFQELALEGITLDWLLFVLSLSRSLSLILDVNSAK